MHKGANESGAWHRLMLAPWGKTDPASVQAKKDAHNAYVASVNAFWRHPSRQHLQMSYQRMETAE